MCLDYLIFHKFSFNIIIKNNYLFFIYFIIFNIKINNQKILYLFINLLLYFIWILRHPVK